MTYTTPTVSDLGKLEDMTQASGQIGSPDGVGFTVQVGVGGVAELSVGVFP